MAGLDLEPDIAELFCHYNTRYFQDTLGACVVSWAEEPLPYGDISGCDYYPGGGGCIILISKSLHKYHTDSDLKSVLLHEMIHAYMFIKDGNTNHSDHGANFKKHMNAINSSSVLDPHRPVGGYNIVMLHEGKKQYEYKCESCKDFIESNKINGPSRDDCIERMGDVCLNSTCQWHRHKMQCSGSYYRIQESPPYCVELNCSRASSKERLDKCKTDKSANGRWHAKHTSNKIEASNKHELEDASTEFLHLSDDAIDNSRKKGSTSSVMSKKKKKLSKGIGFDHLTSATVQEASKRPRTDALSKNQDCSSGEKKRKISKWDGSYSVMVEHVNYYCVDDSDEDEVPLINKRTERRKQQKLRENPETIYIESNNGVRGTISSS